jgi:chromosome segregation ATPase
MASEVQFTDILIALEPTGFSSQGASLVLGLVATCFIATMAGLFIYAYRAKVSAYAKRTQRINELTERLRSQYSNKVGSKSTWDSDISHIFDEVDWLKDHWRSYREQCWEKNDAIASLSNAEDHFKDISPPLTGFTSQIAGILTSIGILGTFIGITVGLGQIGADMSGGSSEDMQNAMTSLISSLGVSFRTSIWGLISSMVITALSNSKASALEAARQSLVLWLNNTMPQKSDRALMAEQTDLISKQVSSTDRLGQTLGNILTESFTKLQRSMDHMSKSIAENQQEGLDALVRQFMDQMQSSMNADFSELGQALKEMVSSNERFQFTMSQLADNLKQATQNQGTSAQQMQDALANAASSIASMQGSFSGLTSVSSNIQEAANAMQQILERQMQASNSQQSTINNMMDGMSNQASSMLNNQEEISKTGQAITEQFSSLAEALQGLITWHNRVKDELSQQIASFQQTIAAQNSIQQKMEDERSAALAIVQQLSTTQANLGPAANAIAGAGTSVKQASDSLFSTEKALRQLLTSVNDATNDMNDRQIQTLDRYQAIHQLLQGLQR